MIKPHRIINYNNTMSFNTFINLELIQNISNINTVPDNTNNIVAIYTSRKKTISKYKLTFFISWDIYKTFSEYWHLGIWLDFGGGIIYFFVPEGDYELVEKGKIDASHNYPDLKFSVNGYVLS